MLDGVQRVWAVVAHPDDEVLGCGATLARLASAGAEVRVCIVARGLEARGSAAPAALAALQEQARAAAAVLGVARVQFLALPDNQLDTVPLLQVVQALEALAEDYAPQVVFTHHAGDLNVDHRVVHQAVLTATRPVAPDAPWAVLGCEVPSSTEWAFGAEPFRPQLFIDVSATLERKVAALGAYTGERRAFPHPRSPEVLRALAQVRGATAGAVAAEAFGVVRLIEAVAHASAGR